jgi:lipoyl synthase
MSDPSPEAPAPTRAQGQRGAAKVARIPVKIEPLPAAQALRKPPWIRVRAPSGGNFQRVRALLREQRLHTVCEEASCPNIGECFGHGTATFMILGDKCTRRCPFCDVAHGRPDAPDADEPVHLARAVAALGLQYVVITSVDRDDLPDRGAGRFAACIAAVRAASPATTVEVLVPDFRHRIARALDALEPALPDVFNHNIETVPRLYRAARPGADYRASLDLLAQFQRRHPHIPTKSGLMVGLGEDDHEVEAVLADLRAHGVAMLTIGQYLAPSAHHLPVRRYVSPAQFAHWAAHARALGFTSVASGPLVRSSYHADLQAAGQAVG